MDDLGTPWDRRWTREANIKEINSLLDHLAFQEENPKFMASIAPEYPLEFGKFHLLRKLARGGMAEIFLASSPDYPQPVVLKRVLPHFHEDTDFLKMFINEARIAAHLHHPGIVQILDLGQHCGQLYLVMEYIDGFDLGRLAKAAGGRISPFVAALIAANLSESLFYANQVCDRTGKRLQVIHRDVTPGNVMIDRTGAVKLVDFGVAKAEAQLDKTRPGVVKGKFRYMSPEQINLKPLDGRSDLFSLGVLLYEITTGQMPFERPQIIDIAFAITSWDPPPPTQIIPNFPQSISEAIMKALKKDRDQRFSNGKEMKAALEHAIAISGGSASHRAEISKFICELERNNYQGLRSDECELPKTFQSFEQKESKQNLPQQPSSDSPPNSLKQMQSTRRIRPPSTNANDRKSGKLVDSSTVLKSESPVRIEEPEQKIVASETTDEILRIGDKSRAFPKKAISAPVSDAGSLPRKKKSHLLLLSTAAMAFAFLSALAWLYFSWSP